MKDIWKKMKDARNIIIFIATISSMTVGGTTYFVTASDFDGHKQEFNDYRTQQKLNYIDRTIEQYEFRRKCFQDECRRKMSDLEWEAFNKKRVEKLRLENELFWNGK